MKKIRVTGIFVFLLVFAISSCAKKAVAPKAGSAKADDMLTLLPQDSMGVIVFDVHKAMATEAAKKAFQEEKNLQKYQEFVQKTGIDPQKDIYFVAAALGRKVSPDEQNGVAVINLRYNKDTVVAAIKAQAPELKEENYNGFSVLTFERKEGKHPTSGVLLDDSNIVFGTEERVKAVIDLYQKKGENILKNQDLAPLFKTVKKDALVWSAIAFPPDAMKTLVSKNPMLSSLEDLKSLTMYFDYQNKAVLAEIKAMGGDEAKNKQIAELLNGLKAMGAIAAAKEPAAGELLNKIEISSGADHVKIYANIPEELMTQLGEKMKKKVTAKEEN